MEQWRDKKKAIKLQTGKQKDGKIGFGKLVTVAIIPGGNVWEKMGSKMMASFCFFVFGGFFRQKIWMDSDAAKNKSVTFQ